MANIDQNKKLRLHLGCGRLYLKGYVNIDYPQTSHTTITVKADRYADLRELDYEAGSVDEVRLHHVFEHFSRQWALRLLSKWHRWLKVGGVLVIETPDFDEAVKRYVSASFPYRLKLQREIFGSQEAHWAYHLDGWGEEKFKFVLEKFGFHEFEFKKILAYHSCLKLWRAGSVINRLPFGKLKDATGDRLPNILVTARKSGRPVAYNTVIEEILRMYMAGNEEKTMLQAWFNDIELH